MKKFILFIPFFLVVSFGLINVNAKEINVTGSYGLTMCTEVVTGAGSSQYVDCAYQTSQQINNQLTTYTILPKAVESFDGSTLNYYVANRLWFFAFYDFKKGNYYTLNFSFNNGSYTYNNLTSYNKFSDLTYGYYFNNDYVQNDGLTLTGYSVDYNSSDYIGTISITFKAIENTTSYRFWIDGSPLLRNKSFSNDQGYRVYLLSAFEEQNNDSALLQQITNQNNTMINQNQQIINNGNQINDNLTDDNVDESTNKATDFFNNFDSGDTGTLTDIISLPLDFLDKLNNSCSPIVLPVPYMGDITLPCLQTYLSTFLPESFLNLIKLIVNGFLTYKIVISLVDFINSLKDPNNDDLEVMDL